MNPHPHVASLILRWQELRRQGRTVTVAELCADCPELTEVVAERLAALGVPDSSATGADATFTTIASLNPEAPPAVSAAEPAGRFRLLGEIARGGMGAVLWAHDSVIGRDVAVKVILPEYRDNPAVVRQFFDEARLAGQLLHPGIAPVYDLGQLPDGRPFFAMKLIEGHTLADLLRQTKGPDRDLPRFLRYFEAVCQAVGYAHTRRVIHRDLKPSNVMVGAFGEVQVMDWGIAKVLPDAREAARQGLAGTGNAREREGTRRGSDAEGALPTEPRSGGAGTPGYMAPEQARGETGCIDPRSDVFGLGAILCEMLTGAPPLRGTTVMLLLAKTRRGDLTDAFARLDGCGADAELVRLAKACLAAERSERPADGGAVAAGVAAYLSGMQERRRRAEMARAQVAEQRKRRRSEVALGHSNLGDILNRQGRVKEAEAAYREAICLKPDNPTTLINLGATLSVQGRFQEAETAYREALRLKPDSALAHLNLGIALRRQGRLREAEAASREALRLEPHNPSAHCALAAALQDQGRFSEAWEAFCRGHALGSTLSGWRDPSAQWGRDAERLVELDHLLPAVLEGRKSATAAVHLELASLCQHPARRLHAAAARLAGAAFVAEPDLANNLNTQPRYNAACSAVLAAAGQAEDAPTLPDEVRPVLRQLALRWLRADLTRYATMAERDDPTAKETVRQRLTHWQTDADFDSVRDKDAVAHLPDAERDAWRQFWADVDAVRQRDSGR